MIQSIYMASLTSSLRLVRLHQPTGIWLLLWPALWAVALASSGLPSAKLVLLFILGAILMRSVGCIINDIADREVDRQVDRTKNRPLASGEMALWQALLLLALLLAGALRVAWLLGPAVMMWSSLALIPITIYPFMKRISWWPQLFLGFTFNWGALIGWAAVRGIIGLPALLLYAGCIFWTLGYDTIYAHQDKIDDARIGVKSTALRLGDDTRRAVGVFYLMASIFWALAGWMGGCNLWFFALLALVVLHLGRQVCTVDINIPASCHRIFTSNAWLGALIWLAFIVGKASIIL